jgi:hypothetical protein
VDDSVPELDDAAGVPVNPGDRTSPEDHAIGPGRTGTPYARVGLEDLQPFGAASF